MAFVNDFGIDAAGVFIDIDSIIKAYTTAQEAEGITPTFEENVDILKDKRKEYEIPQEQEQTKKRQGGWFCGIFNMEIDDFDDEDGDGIYICEYCDKLGYHQKYRPEICDTCQACDSCSQYESGECSGCSFSIYRDGEYYRDKIPESELMTENDMKLFQQLESDAPCERFNRISGIVTKQR
jgi:hypothetical protein